MKQSDIPEARPGESWRVPGAMIGWISELRNRHILLLDLLVFALAPTLAVFLRLDGSGSLLPYFQPLLAFTLIALPVRLFTFYKYGLYNRSWRYATVEDLVHIILACVVGSLVLGLASFGIGRVDLHSAALPRSMPILSGLLVFFGASGTRFCVRLANQSLRLRTDRDAAPALVIGAGSAGQIIVRELLMNPQLGLRPVGFIDDDQHKQGMRILNLPVLGKREDIPRVVEEQAIVQAIIAMPTASGKTVRAIRALCEAAGVPAKTVPGMFEILDGKRTVSQIRAVQIEDLLRREPIQTDIAAVRHLIGGKRVLITGGGGSIGSELARQVLRCKPSQLALMGHGENSVFEATNELLAIARQTGGTKVQALIADIRFAERVRRLVCEFQPDVIFHAAAHKHVPLMEANPSEAASNNIFGTRNVLDAAISAGVERFVLISTDKAVNPTSVMGATKRAAELLVMQAARTTGRNYVAVRFGNVLGSRGSVILTWKQQLAAGGPITVSHPQMTRYFMTIPEAVQLVLQASVLGRGGEVFLLDMGDPVRIVDLARDVIELSGLQVGRDIDIVYTGIRPGEKLFEELYANGEIYGSTQHEKIRLARSTNGNAVDRLADVMCEMEAAVAADDPDWIIACLKRIVPEYQVEEPVQTVEKVPSALVRRPTRESATVKAEG